MMQSQRSRQILAGVVVSVVTLALIGTVLVAMTPVGCGPANKLGLKAITNRCVKSQASAARTPGPTPSTTANPTGSFVPTPNQPPASQPNNPPASQPFNPPASGPFPPDGGPSSGAYPPFTPPASSSGPSSPTLALSCRLPVYVGPPGSGGFIAFPGGSFTADSGSGVTLPSPSPGSSPAPPPAGPGYGYGPGYTGLSYDVAYRRWLPAPYNWVSPNGTRYVHPSPDSIYVENVATGATTELGQGHQWSIAGVVDTGVYATIGNQAGLWFLPFSGAAKQITSVGYWQVASSTAAFGTLASALPQGVSTVISRLDLTTGATSDWFTRQGSQSSVIGLDARGNPVMTVSYFVGGNEVWIATGPQPQASFPIFGTPEGMYWAGAPIADRFGVWFPVNGNFQYGQSTPGIVLYVAGSGLYWMSSLGAQLAGGCH